MGGDILLGGTGSDTLEGKRGDDLIDGDVWLNVQLRAVMNDGTVKLVDSLGELVDDVFADPQRLNPGNITIVKTIVTPAVPAADCGAAAPLQLRHGGVLGPGGRLRHHPERERPASDRDAHPRVRRMRPASDGTDTLRNIEQLQFATASSSTSANGGGATTVAVPSVVGLTQAAAIGGVDWCRLRRSPARTRTARRLRSAPSSARTRRPARSVRSAAR